MKKKIKHNEEIFKKKLIDGLRGNVVFRDAVLDFMYDIFIALGKGNFNTVGFIQNLTKIEKEQGYKDSIYDLRRVKSYIIGILKGSEEKIEKNVSENYDIDIDQEEFEDSDYKEVDPTEKPDKEEKIPSEDLTIDKIIVANRTDLETTGYYANTDSSENFLPHAKGLYDYTKKMNGECPYCNKNNLFRTISQEYGECGECKKIVEINKVKI